MPNRTRTAAGLLMAGAILAPAVAHGAPSPQTPQGGEASPQAPLPQASPQTPAPVGPPPGPVGIVPGPPPTTQWQEPQQNYAQPYSVRPEDIRHAPRPTREQRRTIWKVGTLTVGPWVIPEKDIPDFPNKKRVIRSGNEWSAYAAAEIARFLISVGVPEEKAHRQAAAATLGAIAGGAIGGVVAFTATAVVVGAIAIPLATAGGLALGLAPLVFTVPAAPTLGPVLGPLAVVGPPVAGAAAGAASGVALAVSAGILAGGVGAVVGAVAGGLLGYALGIGDPGWRERPDTPWAGPDSRVRPHQQDRVGPTGPNQFEAHLPGRVRDRSVPRGSYIVDGRGDVRISATFGGQTHRFGWTRQHGMGPIDAVTGKDAARVHRQINREVHKLGKQGQRYGIRVAWPQAVSHGKHARR